MAVKVKLTFWAQQKSVYDNDKLDTTLRVEDMHKSLPLVDVIAGYHLFLLS